jgi:hypothetical protein
LRPATIDFCDKLCLARIRQVEQPRIVELQIHIDEVRHADELHNRGLGADIRSQRGAEHHRETNFKSPGLLHLLPFQSPAWPAIAHRIERGTNAHAYLQRRPRAKFKSIIAAIAAKTTTVGSGTPATAGDPPEPTETSTLV